MSKEGGPDEGARGGSGARDRRAQGQRTGRKAGLRLDSAGSHEKRSAAVRNAGLAGDLQEPHPASTPRHPRIQRERCAAGLARWVLFTKVRGSAKIGVERRREVGRDGTSPCSGSAAGGRRGFPL